MALFSTLQAAGHLLRLLGPRPPLHQERGSPSDWRAAAHSNQPRSKWDISLSFSQTHSHTHIIRHMHSEVFSVLCRSCLVIPGTERELFRELPAPLPGEPRVATKVLFQVSQLISCCWLPVHVMVLSHDFNNTFPLLLGMRWCAATTTSRSFSHWFLAWSSFALIWSWLAFLSLHCQY